MPVSINIALQICAGLSRGHLGLRDDGCANDNLLAMTGSQWPATHGISESKISVRLVIAVSQNARTGPTALAAALGATALKSYGRAKN